MGEIINVPFGDVQIVDFKKSGINKEVAILKLNDIVLWKENASTKNTKGLVFSPNGAIIFEIPAEYNDTYTYYVYDVDTFTFNEIEVNAENYQEIANSGLDFGYSTAPITDITSYKVVSYKNVTNTEDIVIEDLNGIPVTDIDYTNGNLQYFKTLDISKTSILSIPSSAFVNFANLEKIVLPNSISSLSSNVFLDCTKLKNVIIPDTVTSIGYAAFSNCSSLTEIILPNNLISIGDAAFSNCSSLTSILIPNSVTSIGYRTFLGCSSLLNITFPDNLTSIGNSAFKDTAFYNNSENWANGLLRAKTYILDIDKSLTTLTIDEDITVIADNLVTKNYLQEVNFNARKLLSKDKEIFVIGFTSSDGINSPNDFNYPDTTLNIGNNVEVIPSKFFNLIGDWNDSGTHDYKGGVRPIADVLVNTNVTTLGSDCFTVDNTTIWENITQTSPLIIPESVTSMGTSVIGGKYSPSYVKFETPHLVPNMVGNNSSLKQVILSEDTTEIPGHCFAGSGSGLTTFTIPKNVSKIGNNAFRQGSGKLYLTTMRFEQPSGMAVTLPTAGSNTGMCYCKTASNLTVYTDNETIKNYAWKTDNVTATIYHLDGTAW